MNNLQRLDAERDYFVTLNRSDRIDPEKVIETFTYDHPVITHASVAAQRAGSEISGARPDPLLRRLLALGLPRGRLLERDPRLRAAARRARASPPWRAGARRVTRVGALRGLGPPPPPRPGRARVPLPDLHGLPRPRRAPGGPRPAAGLVGAAPGARLVSALRPPRRPGAGRSPSASATGSPSETGDAARAGRCGMLTNLRYFGHCFNPVTLLLLLRRPMASSVEAVLADVTNTPWGETPLLRDRTPTRLGRDRARLEKEFHVSPLMGMDHVYEWRTTVPGGRRCRSTSRATPRAALAFDATLSLERRELDARDGARECWLATRR